MWEKTLQKHFKYLALKKRCAKTLPKIKSKIDKMFLKSFFHTFTTCKTYLCYKTQK